MNEDKSNSTATGNMAVIALMIILFLGMIKIGGGLSVSKFVPDDNSDIQQALISQIFKNKDDFSTPTVDEVINEPDNNTTLRDFEEPDMNNAEIDYNISYSTAMNYFNTRQLSNTEILVLTEDKNFGEYFVRKSQKKLILYKYLNKSFNNTLSTKLKQYSQKPEMKVFNKDNIFVVKNESKIQTSKDRVLYQLYKDCGNFCVIDVPQSKFYMLKGVEANAKSAAICEVIVQNL